MRRKFAVTKTDKILTRQSRTSGLLHILPAPAMTVEKAGALLKHLCIFIIICYS